MGYTENELKALLMSDLGLSGSPSDYPLYDLERMAFFSGFTAPSGLLKTSVMSDRFYRKINALDSQNLNVLHIGDSITEGNGASGPQKRWIDALRSKVKTKYQPPTIPGGSGYIPIGGVYPSVQPGDWSLTGATASVGQGEGFGGSYANMSTSGQTASLTFSGTGIILYFTDYAGNPDPTVTIDGAAVTPIPINSSPTIYGNGIAYTGLARGSHTIVVTVGTTPFHLYGGLVLDGDANAGWRTIVAARSGTQAPGVGTLSVWNYVDPSLVTIYFGVNDYRNNASISTFETNLTTIVNYVKSRSLNPKIVLIKGYEPLHPTTPIAPWSSYRDTVQKVANANNLLCCDILPKFGVGVISATYSADSVHPNDTGHSLIADAIMESLGI